MTDVLQVAMCRERELENELVEVRAFIKKFKEFSSFTSIVRQAVDSSPAEIIKSASESPADLIRRTARRLTITDAAFLILQELGGPIDTDSMVDLVLSKGVQIASASARVSVGSSLSRDSRFENVRGKGWILAQGDTPGVAAPGVSDSTSA